jgi:glutamyl-tRNA synthetase
MLVNNIMSDVTINQNVKTRFCPSPTGLIHLGNARTALFSALFAKKMNGTFLLRIEDTDRERSKVSYTDILMQDLRWLHLYWQEGPEHDGGHGPYYQSKRQAIYDDYYERLEMAGMAYPCFCSEDELSLARKIQRVSGKPPRYSGICRDLSVEAVQEKINSGLKPTLRFRVLNDDVIAYEDFVRGPQKFNSDDIGDFIIRRANGTSPFMFCNAIDDALMGVTHVMRGEDHITNTPRQLLILQALGLVAPQYGHISLITADDGSPLSKRNGSRSIEELRLDGYLFEAVVNYLARLGHYYGHDELLSLDQLAEQFTLEGLSKSPAKFNPQQLNYWQKQAIVSVESHLLWDWLQHQDQQLVPDDCRDQFLDLVKPNIQHPSDLKHWVQVVFGALPTLSEAHKTILVQAGDAYFDAALDAVAQFDCDLKKITQHIADTVGVKGKQLYQPLRIAVTGELHGPELAQILLMMELDEIKQRLINAKENQ